MICKIVVAGVAVAMSSLVQAASASPVESSAASSGREVITVDNGPGRRTTVVVNDSGVTSAQGDEHEVLSYTDGAGRAVRVYADHAISRPDVDHMLADARRESLLAREAGRRAAEDGRRQAELGRAEAARAVEEGRREAELGRAEAARAAEEGQRAAEQGRRAAEEGRREAERARIEAARAVKEARQAAEEGRRAAEQARREADQAF